MSGAIEKSGRDVALELRPAPRSSKDEFWDLFQVYQHELSAHSGSRPDRRGAYPYANFDLYWREPGRYPFFVTNGGETAGLLLLRKESVDYLGRPAHGLLIAEIYVVPRHRGTGLAEQVIETVAAMARREGRCVNWSCYRTNVRALGLYDKMLDRFARRPDWSVERRPFVDVTDRPRFFYALKPVG